jgi:hypothetical protein
MEKENNRIWGKKIKLWEQKQQIMEKSMETPKKYFSYFIFFIKSYYLNFENYFVIYFVFQ